MRMSIDVGMWENNRFILPSGQSGNPVSSHYDDMSALWQKGKGVPIHWSQDSLENNIKHALILTPNQ
jgi:penicillin amidase